MKKLFFIMFIAILFSNGKCWKLSFDSCATSSDKNYLVQYLDSLDISIPSACTRNGYKIVFSPKNNSTINGKYWWDFYGDSILFGSSNSNYPSTYAYVYHQSNSSQAKYVPSDSNATYSVPHKTFVYDSSIGGGGVCDTLSWGKGGCLIFDFVNNQNSINGNGCFYDHGVYNDTSPPPDQCINHGIYVKLVSSNPVSISSSRNAYTSGKKYYSYAFDLLGRKEGLAENPLIFINNVQAQKSNPKKEIKK